MRIYVNVMEILVEQEVVRQIATHSALKELDTIAVTTYALNRVPPLYACSTYGLREQVQRGYQQYQHNIEQAVQWAITAVRKAPRHASQPLTQWIYEQVLSDLRSAQSLGQLNPEHLLQLAEGWLAQDPPVSTENSMHPAPEVCPNRGVSVAEMRPQDIRPQDIRPQEMTPHAMASPDMASRDMASRDMASPDMTPLEMAMAAREMARRELLAQEITPVELPSIGVMPIAVSR
jgi:hypothetical protein